MWTSLTPHHATVVNTLTHSLTHALAYSAEGCHHPPCPHGVAMNMDDTVMPGHHVEAGCEGEVNHPTLVPAHVGQGEEGWYRSEFGCVAWSSFESMSGEMPPDQWGMLTPGGKNRNWNPSNIISKFFGAGAATAMSETGEVAFKRQLYQSMVGQLLFLKTEIEGWRSQNVWGECANQPLCLLVCLVV